MKGEIVEGRLHCWFCGDFIGYSPVPVMWSGRVEHPPMLPDGLVYKECERCGWWHRMEIVPPQKASAA